jgi:hypothetical protein
MVDGSHLLSSVSVLVVSRVIQPVWIDLGQLLSGKSQGKSIVVVVVVVDIVLVAS